MAVVQGIREKHHGPIYDSISVPPEKQLRDVENTGILKFFVNVQGKTKLETNLQSASLLPHYNTFEARAMRVVISDLPPELPEEPFMEKEIDVRVTDDEDNSVFIDTAGLLGVVRFTGVDITTGNQVFQVLGSEPLFNPTTAASVFNGIEMVADLELGLAQLVELLKEARESEDGFAALSPDKNGVTLRAPGFGGIFPAAERVADFGTIFLSVGEIESFIESLPEKNQPPKEQLDPNNGCGTLIGKFIYNTVTTLFVGEKIMIQMPTWFFPAGAGPYSESAKFTTHGEPDPMATFRFAEPLFIDKQQNFRVEIEFSDPKTFKEIQQIYGPFIIWLVLDGYMTRDVQ